MNKNERLQELIAQIRSGDNKAALSAVDELRREGWLMDSSLRRSDIEGADLRGANLRQAVLRDTNLKNCDLSEADLSEAYLKGSSMDGSNLSRTNFTNANIQYVDLRVSNLHGANFTGATCGFTNFAYVDFSTVKGLETIIHFLPSHIDTHTLERSHGNIPEIFLRGCGVSDTIITFAHSLTNKAIDFYSCFISYSHGDKVFARRLHDALQGQGIRCWLDEKQMNPGDDIYTEIDRGIRYWDKFLLCCSKSSLTEKWWVDHEIDKAFQKERELMKDRGQKVLSLIPLNLDGFLLNPAYNDPKKTEITRRIAADFSGWDDSGGSAIFERELARLIKALRTDGGKETPPPSKL